MAPSCINVLLVDNYDSFTYNIAHSIRKIPGTNLQIIEAEKIVVDDIAEYDAVVFSPGPDLPHPGNKMEEILGRWGSSKSILGICLGLQAIYIYYGGKLKRLDEPVHGRKMNIIKSGERSRILADLPSEFEAGLYHSWIADPGTLPGCLRITAFSTEGRIMAIKHHFLDIEAVQFHPESIMTPLGDHMIRKWLE
jgi:anthranilate synthase component 2